MASTSTSVKQSTVSQSSWFLTADNNNEVLVWKNKLRLKLPDGTSTGFARTVAAEDLSQGIIRIQGSDDNSSKEYIFRGLLKKYDASGNTPLNKKLSEHITTYDAAGFCQALDEMTNVELLVEDTGEKPVENKRKRKKKPGEDDNADTGEKLLENKRKRKRKPDEDDPAVSKKSQSKSEMETSEQLIGQFEVMVDCLQDPPSYFMIRETKDWYVDYLADNMKKGSDLLTAPFVVLCNESKATFDVTKMNDYRYDVIGGVHRFNAIRKINSSGIEDTRIMSQKCVVYGCGLSKESILLLAQQHNTLNQIQRVTTFPETVGICRRLLFKHFAPGKEDDGNFSPDVPRYNTKSYRDWKLECFLYTVTPRVGESTVLQAIQMALQPSNVYHLMQQVFKMYEEGKLKGKRERDLSNPDTLQKSLEGALSAKLTHFKTFQGLQDEQKVELLVKLKDKEITYDAAVLHSKEMKQLNSKKDLFLKSVEIDTWKEAEEKIPRFAKESKLKLFAGNSSSSKQAFLDYCDEAKLANQLEEESIKDDQVEHLMFQGQRIQLHQSYNITTIANVVKNHFSMLCVTALKEWTLEDLHHCICCMIERNKCKSFCLLVKGLNSYSSLIEKFPQISFYKIITLLTPCKENAVSGKGYATVILLAYFGEIGQSPPSYLEKDDSNGFLCVKAPVLEYSEYNHDPIDWLKFLFKKTLKSGSTVLDVYGSAELIEEAATKRCDVVSLQRSSKALEYITQFLSSIDSTQEVVQSSADSDSEGENSNDMKKNNGSKDKKNMLKTYPIRNRQKK